MRHKPTAPATIGIPPSPRNHPHPIFTEAASPWILSPKRGRTNLPVEHPGNSYRRSVLVSIGPVEFDTPDLLRRELPVIAQIYATADAREVKVSR